MHSASFNAMGPLALLLVLSITTTARASGTDDHVRAMRASAQTIVRPAASSKAANAWGPVQIVIYKSKRSLAIYRGGEFDSEYPVVLGLKPDGRKSHAHDARTPEGMYHVVSNRRHERWQYFLALDYPNAADRDAYEAKVRAGRIPDEDGEPFGIGGSLGIHGNDRAAEQEAGIDWTKGCVALRAADIAAVAAASPVGTPVWIVE